MSLYYWFSEQQQEYIEHDKPMDSGKYLYDPVTDSYVENISTHAKENYLHNKYGRYGFDGFYRLLNKMIYEKHRHIKCRIISMGDYTFDEEIELSCGDKKIRYSAYAMYILSESPEDTIDSFMNILAKMDE